MKVKKFKRVLMTVGAGLAAASILAACSDGADKEKNNADEAKQETVESAGKDTDSEAKPVESTTQAAETKESEQTDETNQSEEAKADVYGDGVSPADAKSEENGLGFLREQLGSNVGTMCGFAYLGSVSKDVSLKDLINNSDTANNFTFIKDMDTKNIINDGGNDIFVFVPTDNQAKVVVNSFAESDNGKTIYSSDKGTPIFIRTTDELNDSIEIVITDSVGNVGHFSPDIGTGSIADLVYKDVTGYNFGTDATVSKGIDKKYMFDTLIYREPDLNDLLAGGASLSDDSYKRIYIDDLEFYTLDFGRNNNGKFEKERFYAVSKDGSLIYRYNPAVEDWVDLLAFDFNAAQYR